MATIINASTSAGLIQTADTSGTLQLQSNGVTQQTIDSTGSYGQLARGTAQASTSGTSITFSSIPSWVKRITVMFQGVSTSGSSLVQVQIGSGSVVTTGYASTGLYVYTSGTNSTTATTGFVINASGAAGVRTGQLSIANISSNTWVASGTLSDTSSGVTYVTTGVLALSGSLDRVVVTTVNGTDTFDAGSINILYEG
jgi:hypothetical protein